MSGRRPRAFTLAELIVVVGIIALLAATLLPMVSRARVSAKRARMSLDLNSIAIALDAYHDDFGDYPRPTDYDYAANQRGAAALCQALLAPGPAVGYGADGADGLGFRTRRADTAVVGKIHGPYLRPESFKLNLTSLRSPLILDIDGQPILYYVARANKPNIHLPENFVALAAPSPPRDQNVEPGAAPPLPLFNVFDNSGPYPDGLHRMRLMLGDVNVNGAIDGGETPASTGPYLLWSAGPDSYYGPPPGPVFDPFPMTLPERRALRAKVDDVTNFQFK